MAGALAHIGAADLAQAVALYRSDDDKTGFLLHVRGAMLAAGLTHNETSARLESFLAMAR